MNSNVRGGSNPPIGTKGEGRMRAFDGLYPHRMSIHSLRVAIEDYTS